MAKARQEFIVALKGVSKDLVNAMSNGMQSIESLINTGNNASKALESTSHNISQSFEEGTKSLEKSIGSQIGYLDNLQKSSEKTAKELENINKRANVVRVAFTALAAKLAGKAFDFARSGIKKINEELLSIGENSKKLGVSCEYFQKLEKNAQDAGVGIAEVSDVFKNINKTAKKAMEGDATAIKALHGIGIEVEDLMGKNPQQIFERIAYALGVMGDSAIEQKLKVEVCGNSVEDLNSSLLKLSETSQLNFNGIFSDDTVDSAIKLQNATESLKDSLLVLADTIKIPNLLKFMAGKFSDTAEEVGIWIGKDSRYASSDKKNDIYYKNTDFGEDNAYKDQIRKIDLEAIELYRKAHPIAAMFKSNRGILDNLRYEGLTPGQMQFKEDFDLQVKRKKNDEYKKTGVRSGNGTLSKKDISEAYQKLQEKRKILARQAAASQNAEETTGAPNEHHAPISVADNSNRTQRGRYMPPIYARSRISNAPAGIAGNGVDFRAMVAEQKRTNDLLAKNHFVKVKN